MGLLRQENDLVWRVDPDGDRLVMPVPIIAYDVEHMAVAIRSEVFGHLVAVFLARLLIMFPISVENFPCLCLIHFMTLPFTVAVMMDLSVVIGLSSIL